MMRSAFAATLVVAVSAVHVSAQAPPTPPDHYALTNARIVTAPGRVIERGTVVMQDGRITAVGAQVSVPASAVRIDAAGHTVYPGLIDVAVSAGLPSYGRQGGPRGGGGGFGGGPRQPGDGEEVMPGREAADVWEPSDADLAALRGAGITAVGLAFNGGIFPGRTAAATTAASGSRVLRPAVAQQVLLGRRRGGYPGTLMASLSFVKQSLYDAQHEMRVRAAWERQPSGTRPEFNADSRALEPVVSGALPVWFHASAERDLDRIIELAGETGIRNYAIVGVQEGWRAEAALRQAARPLAVSLDWPDAGDISGRAFELHVAPMSGPDEAKERADSAAVRQARGNAAALHRAGLQIALTSYGMSSPAQLRRRVRAAIDAGLPADEALRALTVSPARMLGIEGLAGTIETGKLANLVVVRGNDLFAPDAPIRDVFVEGVRYDVPAETQRQRGREDAQNARGAGTTDIAGQYVGEMDSPHGLVQFTFTLSGSGDRLRGRLSSEMGDIDLTGSQTGQDFVLTGTWTPPGMTALSVSVTGRVTGDDLRGTFTAQGQAAMEFTARRGDPGTDLEEVG
jgi:imidazolonepropionase-like amidohydrolase